MISKQDIKIIQEVSEEYNVNKVMLFGSGLNPKKESNDIDIAVEGVAHKKFYKYYGELMLKLSKPVDVIDLSGTSKFVELIQKEGVLLYG